MSRKGKGHRCAYCDRILEATTSLSRVAATKDHAVPQCLGGTETVWCCRQCNSIKGKLSPAEWAAFMAACPRWWTLAEYAHHGRARRVA